MLIKKVTKYYLRGKEKEATHRGYLKTRPMPGWRYFKVKDILSVNPTDIEFNEVRPDLIQMEIKE